MSVSLNQQIEEVEREIALRERVYPNQVARGKMRQGVADFHKQRMVAVLETLKHLDRCQRGIQSDH
jgi:hypothetical protein